jgi:hypothetical protein
VRYEPSTHINFEEDKYLVANPDVIGGIQRREFKSGQDHFEKTGIFEGRYQKISLEKDSPLAVIHVPKCSGTSLRIEIDSIQSNMYNGVKYSMKESKRQFLRNSRNNFLQPDHSLTTWTPKELRAAHDQYECLMGHISFADFHKAGFREFLLIVREPRIRLLSEYLFLASASEYRQKLENYNVSDIKSYFSEYASKISKNVIANLGGGGFIFDWRLKELKFISYWNDEISKVMMNMFGRESQNLRVNVTRTRVADVDFRILDLVHELTEKDSAFLSRLMNSGLLTQRSKEQLDEEFSFYLKNNFNYVKRLI